MFGVRIDPLHRLLCLHFHVGLLELSVQEGHAAIAGVVRHQVQRRGLRTEHTPHHPLVLVARQGHADAGGIAFGQGLDCHIVFHIVVLSQPFPRCLQKPQLLGRVLPQSGQLRLAHLQVGVQGLPVIVDGQDLPDGGQAEPQILQRCDAEHLGQMVLAVVAIPGHRVDLGGGQQPFLVVVAQHADTDSGQFGKFTDLQHSGTSVLVLISELKERIRPDTV